MMQPITRQGLARSTSVAGWVACIVVLGLAACTRPDADLAEPHLIAEHAAWTWFNDERALIAGDALYVGYVDTAGYTGVTVYPLTEGGTPQRFRLGSFMEKDDHNNPALVHLDDGRVLAAYAPHHTQPYWYWRHAETVAETVADTVAWSPERRTDDLGYKTTYSNLFQLVEEGGRLYNFFRGANYNPTFMTSDDGGEAWSAPQHFILSGVGETRPYVKYASNGAGRIDLLYTQGHPRREENDLFHVYYEDGYLHRSDGTRIQPLPGAGTGPMPVEAGTRVYAARTAGRAWVWDLAYDSGGAPVAVYIAARDSTVGNDLRYRYARWEADEERWRDQEIAYAGTHLYDGENHYAGGIALNPADPNVVYTSSDVHPATGDATAHYQIYRGSTDDGGATWTWVSLTPGATTDHLRPFVTRRDGARQAVLWLRGRYTRYQDYDTDIVGLLHR